MIKEEIQRLDPALSRDDLGFHTAVVLLPAVLVVGPDIDRLVAFTGYSRSFVADISRRMHESGLWANGEVNADHWFEGDKVTAGLWVDCLVAEGLLVARRREDGQWEYRARRAL